jgi:hypothetical protein
MHHQPKDTGRNIPTHMTSRVRVVGPQRPSKADTAKAAETRNAALKKQRDAMK